MRKLILSVLIFSSSLSAETLKEAMQSAYETNSALRAKIYEHFSVQEKMPQARAGFLPSVNVNASTGVGRNTEKTQKQPGPLDPVSAETRSDSREQSVELAVTQNLFRGLGDVSQVSAAQHEIDASHYDYINTEQEVILSAADAYATVIFCEKSVRFNVENEKFLGIQLEAVTLAKDAGEKTNVDVSQAKAGLAEARAKRIQAKGELANAQANYRNVTGRAPGTLAYPDKLPVLPQSLDSFLAILQQKNPKIRQAQLKFQQAKHGIDVNRAGLLPSLDLQGSVGRRLAKHDDGRAHNTYKTTAKSRANSGSVRLQLTVPLYNRGGSDWSHLRQANHQAVQTRLQLEQTRKDAIAEATKAWDNWVTAKESIALRRAQVEFSKISRDGAFLGYEVGETSYLDALDAQNKLLAAQEGLEEARKNELVQHFKILALMGELTHRDVELKVKSYPIKEHYEQVKHQWIGTDNSEGAEIAKLESGS